MDDTQRGFDYAISLDAAAEFSQWVYFWDIEIPDVSVHDDKSGRRGEGSLSHQSDLPDTQGRLIATRGMGSFEAGLCVWIEKTTDAMPGMEMKARTMIVQLLDITGQAKVSWRVVDAVPLKWSKSFDAAAPAQILIERVEFTCGAIERIN